MLRGDFGVYTVFEQKLYRVGGDDDRGIGIFARASYSPADRNLIDYYADGGIAFTGLSDQRPKDKFGIGRCLRARVAVGTRTRYGFSKLVRARWPIRRFEGLVTAVYQYEIRAGWTLQPNFQHVQRPGGGETNPLGSNPGKVLRNAEVFGLRSVVKFLAPPTSSGPELSKPSSPTNLRYGVLLDPALGVISHPQSDGSGKSFSRCVLGMSALHAQGVLRPHGTDRSMARTLPCPAKSSMIPARLLGFRAFHAAAVEDHPPDPACHGRSSPLAMRAFRVRVLDRLSQSSPLADERLLRSLDVQQEEATKTFELINLTMSNASDLVAGMSGEDIRQNGERLHEQFKKYSDAVEVIQSIWIYGADGRALVSSSVYPPPAQSYADRDFFRRSRQGERGHPLRPSLPVEFQ